MNYFFESKMSKVKSILLSISLYIIWVIATYLLEGRILTLLRPEAVIDRIIYSIVANIIIGIVVAAFVLRSFIISKFVTLPQIGFRSFKRTIAAVILVGVIGFLVFIFQGPPSLNPIVILNAYSQVFVVSVAEVVVCWAVIGSGFESFTKSKGKITSVIIGVVVAVFLFGIYHYAHSPPFNQLNMVIFLMIPGLATSLVYFLGRDIYATIVFHNFLGTLGVMQAMDLTALSKPLYPIISFAVITLLFLIGANLFLSKKASSIS